jgi:vancomycin permeability regulator SanA
MKKIRKIIIILTMIILTVGLISSVINIYMVSYSKRFIINEENFKIKADAVIVLGAYVFPNGEVSWMLRDRLDTALKVYTKAADKIIVSGDHGNKNYNEVRAMKDHLLEKGVSEHDIFMDHAGFSTYDSMYRAKEIFLLKKAIISTQRYHLYRAIYAARKLGIEAYGIEADLHVYPRMSYYQLREALARVKDYFYVLFKVKPVFAGPVIDIKGSGLQTEDGKNY